MRNLGWITYKANGGKTNSIDKFWPIDVIKEDKAFTWGETPEEAKANYEAILKAHNIK